jgi:hypothetical protein
MGTLDPNVAKFRFQGQLLIVCHSLQAEGITKV